MDLTIVAVYTICDDLLISIGHRNHPQAKMSDAEVMTTALVAARYFGGNPQTASAVLKTLGYIPKMLGHSRFNRRPHQIPQLFQTLFEYLAEGAKAKNPNEIFVIDAFPVAVCDNIQISCSRIYQGEAWRGKITSKHRYFYGIKAHLMVSEVSGDIVEVFFTPCQGYQISGKVRYYSCHSYKVLRYRCLGRHQDRSLTFELVIG